MVDLFALVTGEAPRGNHRATVIVDGKRPNLRSILGIGVDEAIRVTAIPASDATRKTGTLVQGSVHADGIDVKLLNPDVLFAEDWGRAEESTDV